MRLDADAGADGLPRRQLIGSLFAYTVRIDFDDPAVLRDTLAWLRDRHVSDVLAAGARAADLVLLDGAHAIEIRYRFASREAFEAYERDHAPRLRSDGLSFLAGRTARFTRTTGPIVAAFGP